MVHMLVTCAKEVYLQQGSIVTSGICFYSSAEIKSLTAFK